MMENNLLKGFRINVLFWPKEYKNENENENFQYKILKSLADFNFISKLNGKRTFNEVLLNRHER